MKLLQGTLHYVLIFLENKNNYIKGTITSSYSTSRIF